MAALLPSGKARGEKDAAGTPPRAPAAPERSARMTSKSGVLLALEQSRGEYLSGEELARRLGISRSAVWKAIEELRRDGCAVEAVTRRGYRLAAGTDLLSAEGIRAFLPEGSPWQITCLETVGSTNRAARELAQSGAPHGTVVAADRQTEGRGRFGRSFYSPPGTGVYLSAVLRPAVTAEEAGLLTAGAAVAVCRAVRALSAAEPQIKWVNDIFVQGRKAGGILTEAATSLESGMLEYAVLGVGLNCSLPSEGFPPELQDTAGPLFPAGVGEPPSRNRLAAEVLVQLQRMLEEGLGRGCLEEYRVLSTVLGKDVWVLRGEDREEAHALEIDDEGRLVVQTKEGIRRLRSGEVSLRLKAQDPPAR